MSSRQLSSPLATTAAAAAAAPALHHLVAQHKYRPNGSSERFTEHTLATMAPNNPFKFGTDLWDTSNRFETSWLLSPWALFGVRALICLYTWFTRFYIIGWTCTHDSLGGCLTVRRSFSYFTYLTFWGLQFYFLVASIHTFTYARTGRPLLDRFPRPLQALHSLFYSTIVTYPFLVTIVYWVVLYDGRGFPVKFTAFSNVSQHALNSLFALFEVFIPRTSPPLWVHIPFLIFILALYLALAYITVATQDFYVYSFLDYRRVGGRGIVAAYIIGIAVGIVIIFCIVWCIIWLRKWVTETKLHKEGKFTGRPTQHDAEMNSFENKYATAPISETPDRIY